MPAAFALAPESIFAFKKGSALLQWHVKAAIAREELLAAADPRDGMYSQTPVRVPLLAQIRIAPACRHVRVCATC